MLLFPKNNEERTHFEMYLYILGDIYNTVLSVYSHEVDRPLPQSEEVLLCTPSTTLDMVNKS